MNREDKLTIAEAAKRLGRSQRRIRQMIRRGQLPGAAKVDGRWLIPIESHPDLAAGGADRHIKSAELENVSPAKREDALRKLGLIVEFESYAAGAERQRIGRVAAMECYCRQKGIAKRTLQMWIARYRNEGLAGLIDMRGQKISGPQAISNEAWEMFKSLWLDQRQPSVKQCWQQIRHINATQQRRWKIPSLSTMKRLAKQRIPLPVRVLHREGLNAYNAKCAPYVLTDPDSVEPGSVWVGDHSQFNCWVRHRGRWIRPWLTAWLDMRSRHLMGWYISAQPNQTTVLLAMRRAIERHGPPESVRIDNGKDYDSEMWTGTTKTRRRMLKAGYLDEQMIAGIYALMNVTVSFAIPYHPQSKLIERFFDTVDRQFSKTVKTYCGKDTARKPEYIGQMLKDETGGYALSEFAELFDRYAETYNNTAHSGVGMDNRSPAQVLAERRSQRMLADGVLDLLMRVWSGELTVGKNGVKFKGLWYGQYDAELLACQGRKVRVSYNPDDLRQVYVYDAATLKLITIAEQARLISFGSRVDEQGLREAMRQKSRAVKIARQYKDSRLTANTDLTELALRAMEDAAEKPPQEKPPATLKPVRTALDDQVADHRQRQAIKAVRRAAGAESIQHVVDLDLAGLVDQGGRDYRVDFDLSQLRPQGESADLGLFDG